MVRMVRESTIDKKKKKKPVLAIVEWGDAHAMSRWVNRSEVHQLHGPLVVRWVGFIQINDDTGITLCFGFDENDNPAGQMFVPRGMIKKITKVKY